MSKPRLVWEGHRQRLRQRMEREGWDALRPHEMVELVLNYAVPRQNLSDVARALVERFGSVGGVFAADRAALLAVEGMTETLAEWVCLTGELMRAYHDLQAETDLRLSCYQEVLAFLKPRLAGRTDAPGLWAAYVDFDFNLITYTDFGRLDDCWDAAVARRVLVEAVNSQARYVCLMRFTAMPPALARRTSSPGSRPWPRPSGPPTWCWWTTCWRGGPSPASRRGPAAGRRRRGQGPLRSGKSIRERVERSIAQDR